MRDILFRGKTEDDKWVEGYLFVLGKGTEYEETYILGDLDHRETVYDIWKCAERVIPETVGEFIGITDKYGKKVFEDDILSQIENPYRDTPPLVRTVRQEMSCGSCCSQVVGFGASGKTSMDFIHLDDEFEVIGNIHDNPELL